MCETGLNMGPDQDPHAGNRASVGALLGTMGDHFLCTRAQALTHQADTGPMWTHKRQTQDPCGLTKGPTQTQPQTKAQKF